MTDYRNLQERIDAAPSALAAFRDPPAAPYPVPVPPFHTNWRDEQTAWAQTVALYDQSFHMTDLYINGPDTLRLLSDTSVSGYADFTGRAKQYIAVNSSGRLVGDAIAFGLEGGVVNVVGVPSAANWLKYHAAKGGYDVELQEDLRTVENPGARRTYRIELMGPLSGALLERAQGSAVEPTRFFQLGRLRIADRTVHTLNHTMAGVPGDANTGLELFGLVEDRDAVLEAILGVGEEFGLLRGGSVSYVSTNIESGWVGLPTPAIYTDPDLRDYREGLPAFGYEGSMQFSGSFDPESIEGYYLTPWDAGYGRLIKFDHDFIGRDALEELAKTNTRRKAWVVWDRDDVVRIMRDSVYEPASRRPRALNAPIPSSKDAIVADGEVIGYTFLTAYSSNLREWSSFATIDEQLAPDGATVELRWGTAPGQRRLLGTEEHVPTTVAATVSWDSPAAR